MAGEALTTKNLFTAVCQYPAVNFGQFISMNVTHIHVISATVRRQENVKLVSQTGREICVQCCIILIKIVIFGASDSMIISHESG